MNTSPHAVARSPIVRSAFTLAELLVVVAIIGILIGLLIPVVKHVRIAAYNADTSNELNQIASAINSYYTTFHAYPGPFSDDQIDDNLPSGFQVDFYAANSASAVTLNTSPSGVSGGPNITGSQNLVLGLLGGLRYIGTNPSPYVTFVPQEVGLGPMNLTSAGQRYTPFMPLNSGTTSFLSSYVNNAVNAVAPGTAEPNVTRTADAAGTMAADSPIPVFVDRYPSPGPLPILYLRARTDARGIICDGVLTDPTTSQTAIYQYDIRPIMPYTNTNLGLKTGTTHDLVPNSSSVASGSPAGSSTITFLNTSIAKAGVYSSPDAGPYFANPSIPPTQNDNDQDYNATGTPRSKNAFILISAGPDGIYGTADDITSFGDVSP